jgi:peptidoglycan/LPS O-acetylase OafA/YrhL
LLAQRERAAGLGDWRRLSWPLAIVGAVGMLALRIVERFSGSSTLLYNIKWPMVSLVVFGGMLVVLTSPPQFLRWKVLVWIGRVSYGVYVYHALFGDWLHRTFSLRQAPIIFLLQLLFTLPVAALSWYYIEAPILKLKKRWQMPSAV